MAYASWVTPNKVSGSGNDTVSWTGASYSGRVARTTTATFSAAGVANKTLTINQSGPGETISIQGGASVSKDGVATLTINGSSNSSKLTFSLANNNIGLNLPSTYQFNSASATSGQAIPGDPGASSVCNYNISFSSVPANTGTTERTTQLIVTNAAGDTATCLITQAAADAYLTISPTSIELNSEGTAVSVTVSSNTNWTVA